MLKSRNRFHGYGSLRKVYNQSQGVRGSLISLRYANRPQNKPYRVAVVVSRKVNKSAVVRNRIRRRIYEIARNSESIPESMDLIFTVFNDQVAELPIKELTSQINQLLVKSTKI